MADKQLPWHDPMAFAARYAAADHLVFLHSTLHEPSRPSKSILAVGLEETVMDNWASLEPKLSYNAAPWENAWFGYLGYELKNHLESFSELPQAPVPFPALWMGRFATVFLFDHRAQTLTRYGPEPEFSPVSDASVSAIREIHSNFTRQEYLQKVERTLEMIRAGEFYQANITRKFFGSFTETPEPFAIFQQLCERSPAAYSAFVKIGEKAIISSSPECFLTIDASGAVESRPIKGTAPRGATEAEDTAIEETLRRNPKDRAENLMIVDLMRNDFSRCCVPGSIQVNDLHAIHRFATLHHMISTVQGTKRPDVSTLDVVRGCFPPGSMTGTPKIHAMQWCDQTEQVQRGVYSGAIGWFGGDGSCDLSVVIRTLLVDGECFEFQVGGGIVADSTAETEWRETLTKARAIAQTLGITQEMLEKL